MRIPILLGDGGWGVRWQGCCTLIDNFQSPVSELRFSFRTAIYEIEEQERHNVQLWATLIGARNLPDSIKDPLESRICDSVELIDAVGETILGELTSETPPIGPIPTIVLMCFRIESKEEELFLVTPRKRIPIGISM